MSSSRVAHEQDKLLKTTPSKVLLVLASILIYLAGNKIESVSGLHVVRNNNNRSSSSSDNYDLEPKTGLDASELATRLNANVSIHGKFVKRKEVDNGQGQEVKLGDNETKPHGNNATVHQLHRQSGELETGSGEKNETGDAQQDVPQDPFSVEDILRKIFGEFEEEDEADEDELLNRNDAGLSSDEDTLILESRSEVEVPSEKSGNKTHPVKLSRHIRDESESRQNKPPTRRNKLKSSGSKRKPGASAATPLSGNNRPSKGESKAQNLAKYNEYMDAVLGRMNILIKKKRMDPLRVNLYSGPSKTPGNKGNKKNHSNRRVPNKKDKKKKNNARMDLEDDEDDTIVKEAERDDVDEDEAHEENGPAIRDVNINRESIERQVRSLLSNISGSALPQAKEENLEAEEDDAIVDSIDTFEEGRAAAAGDFSDKPRVRQNKVNRTNSSKGGGKGKKRKQNLESSGSGNKSSSTSHKTKSKAPSKHKNRNPSAPRPTRGILHGLSTLRRDGNVQVIRDGAKARIVRAKFFLGPVALEILPKKGKKSGNSQEASSPNGNPLSPASPTSPALTATAPQLKGVLEVRLSPSSPTRIRKLRVFPPGKVQVDGDKTNKGVAAGLRGPGYRKISPHATARLRQAAVQVVRQVDHKMRIH